MATFLDAIAILKVSGFFAVVVPFLFIFAVVFGVLTKFKIFGENISVNLIVATVAGLVFVSFSKAGIFLENFLPLITGFLVVLVFLIAILLFIGVKQDTIEFVMRTSSGYGSILAIVILLSIISLVLAFPEFLAAPLGQDLPVDIAPSTRLTLEVLSNPLIISTIIVLLIFGVSAYFITIDKSKA